MKVEAGATLVIETGEYSDYSLDGPFKVLKAFDQAEIAETFERDWQPSSDSLYDRPDGREFVSWLTRHGYIEDVPNVISWHVGSYGRFEPEIQKSK